MRKRVVITGAAGFLGRAVVRRIDDGVLGDVALVVNDVRDVDHPSATVVTGSYADGDIRARLCDDRVDVLFHLASLPGGASERDPVLGKVVNLDGSIALIDMISGPRCPTVVYASSIAALGRSRARVTDSTILRPSGSYGTHKAMVEYYLADLTRRGVVDGRAVRPAGIVARPRDAFAGFATAWMSDLFHAAIDRRDITVPARAATHIWLQSVDTVADNIIHAAQMSSDGLTPARAWTLPATVVRIDMLVDALCRYTGHPLRVTYGDGQFDQPSLDASGALDAGFTGDGVVEALVQGVMSGIERECAVA